MTVAMHVCARFDRWFDRELQSDESSADPSTGSRSVALSWRALLNHNCDDDVLAGALQARGVAPEDVDPEPIVEVVELEPLNCLDTQAFERQTDRAYVQMQSAKRLGAGYSMIASAHEGQAGFDMFVDALTRLAALAERTGIRLCVRNVAGSAAEQLDELHVLFREVKGSPLALCLDNLEFQRAAVNPADAVISFGRRIECVRLRDETPSGPCAPGEGRAHVFATLDSLVAEGFAGPLIVNASELPLAATVWGRYLD